MNIRAFLKGDSKQLNTSTELERYNNVTPFAAPKRTYSKPNNTTAKSHRKVPDENQYPIDESLAKTRRLEGISDIYQSSKKTGVLDDLQPSNIGVTTEYKTDTKEGGETGPHSIRKKDHMEKATKDLSFRLDSTDTVSDMRRKQAKQEDDVMLVSLIEEIDRLNGLLLEKITENEKLKLINVSLEMRVIDLEGPQRHKSVSKNSIDHSIMDSKVRYGTYETMNSEEDSKMWEEGPSGVHNSTRGTNLQQPKWNSSRKVGPAGPANGTIAAKNKEKKGTGFNEKGKIEELLKSVDLLNQSVNEKEKENSTLYEEVDHVRRAYEMVGQKLLQQQQVTEKLRSELMNAHAQNQELNRELLAVKASSSGSASNNNNSGNSKVTTISFSRVESTNRNFSHQEVSEWQKKYEFTKNDNERLIKIVEENHKTIQSFKDIFKELENRHNITFGELKKEYEYRIRGMEESRSETKRNQTFSAVSSSVNTSQLGRSLNGFEVNRGDT